MAGAPLTGLVVRYVNSWFGPHSSRKCVITYGGSSPDWTRGKVCEFMVLATFLETMSDNLWGVRPHGTPGSVWEFMVLATLPEKMSGNLWRGLTRRGSRRTMTLRALRTLRTLTLICMFCVCTSLSFIWRVSLVIRSAFLCAFEGFWDTTVLSVSSVRRTVLQECST